MESQAPVVRRLSALSPVGEGALWGSTAEAVAHPLRAFVPGDYERLLAEIGPPVAGLVRRDGDGYLRRTRCLWITLPEAGAPCATCCVPAGG